MPLQSTMVLDTMNLTKTTASDGSLFNFSGERNGVFENPFDQPPVRITFILLFSVVFAMCFLGNIVVLIVFAYSKRMRTRTNLFLANLAAADFCVGVFCVLPNLSINLSPVWRLGRVMCKLYFFVNYLAYTASVLLLVVIAVERYIAIMHPLRSRGYFTAPRLLVAQVVVWVVAAVYNIPILLMFDTVSTQAGAFCYMTLPLMNMTAYYTAHFVLWYLLPLTAILVMYGRISCTLWATSAASVPASRLEVRNGASVTLDAGQHSHHGHNHHHHLHHGGGALPKCCLPSSAGRSCITYCETIGENEFGSVVTVGVLPGSGNGGRGGGGGGGGSGNGGGGDLSRRGAEGRGLLTCSGSKLRLLEGEEGGGRVGGPGGRGPGSRRGGGGGGGVGGDSDTTQRLLLTSQPREINGHVEMVAVKSCTSACFNCIHSRASPGPPGSSRYSPRLNGGYPSYHNHNALSKRAAKRPKNSDEYAYELSDVASSDDYDSYRSRADGGGNVGGTGAGEGNYFGGGGGGVGGGGGGGGGGAPPRRLRTHCRISSQRGLTSRRRVIRLLVAVVTIFAICVLPFHLRNLLHYWHVYESRGGIFDLLSPIASVMMYLNCGLNPFIYWMFSDHFRRSLKETVCFWKRTRRNNSILMVNSPRQQKNSALKHHDVM